MKITIVLGAFFPVPPVMGGAVEKVWLALAREFVRHGHEVTLISRAFATLPKTEMLDGVRHLRVKGFDSPASLLWLKILDLIYSWRVRSILKPADLIVTNTFWLPILLRNARYGALYVHVARFPKRQMRLYRHAARLQTPSNDVARAIEKELRGRAEQIRVIPNPLTAPAEGIPPRLSARDKIVLYVGRLHPEKGVHLLVHAFAHLAGDKEEGWRLVVVGPAEAKFGGGGEPYLQQLKEAAANAGDRIEFRGAIFDDAALMQEYRRARLFVYPSLAETGESFGLAPLEAMAHGCAVLVSGLSCFHDFIQDGATGFSFDHRAPVPEDALRDRLRALMRDEALLEHVSAAGREVAAGFSITRVADQFLADFDAVVRARG